MNELNEGGHNERETGDRVGLGLLSRFLGAVFLVLFAGLLLLDNALLQANRNQATFDAQSSALLTESFLSGQFALLGRASDAAMETEGARDTTVVRRVFEQLLATMPGARRLWLTDPSGRVLLDVSESPVNGASSAPPTKRFDSVRLTDAPSVIVVPIAPRRALVGLFRVVTLPRSGNRATIGLVFDGDALRNWLRQATPDTRLTLAILSGGDTVAFVGEPDGNEQALAIGERTVRLPTGGTWRATTTHALTTRLLRWLVWALGVFGVSLLALGLLREQRRALLMSERSVELERLYSDVKRANQAKSEFLANVSHELRTPLNAIVGFVELLRDGFYGDLSPRQVLPVDRIAASATHLRHLVDQVLDIAKIAAGRLEVHAESIVLRPFVLNVASELESLVSEKGLAFSITIGASLPRVRTDPTHLRQILINLIGNAVKYTPAGTISVRTRLVGAPLSSPRRSSALNMEEASGKLLLARAPRGGTWIALQVVDTGVGIGAADLERIFDEFEQVNAGPRGDSMQRGTGLGLAISRRLARLLGGDISVESELGRGSTFTVWIPVNPADLIREPVRPATASRSNTSA